jgi:hypothetical protein
MSTTDQASPTAHEAQAEFEKMLYQYMPSHHSSIMVKLLRNLIGRAHNQGALEAIAKLKAEFPKAVT